MDKNTLIIITYFLTSCKTWNSLTFVSLRLSFLSFLTQSVVSIKPNSKLFVVKKMQIPAQPISSYLVPIFKLMGRFYLTPCVQRPFTRKSIQCVVAVEPMSEILLNICLYLFSRNNYWITFERMLKAHRSNKKLTCYKRS